MKSNSEKRAVQNTQATRETVESVVIAVILAFLFRGFVAEAFVIPTGSMAPTLMGRHIDVTCPQCKYSYRTGATEENERHRGVVETTYCPMCRFPLDLNRAGDPNQRSFTGDRILVSKFAYELEDPKRWDVIVFKYPGNAKQNYIKRLVGLPNELIRIRHGDIYVAQLLHEFSKEPLETAADDQILELLRRQFETAGLALGAGASFQSIPRGELPETVTNQACEAAWLVTDGDKRYYVRVPRYEPLAAIYSDFAIARKPVDKMPALLQTVFDTRHPGEQLVQVGWPSRWRDEALAAVWRQQTDGTFTIDAAPPEMAWLRYRHIYPSENEWSYIINQKQLPESLTRSRGELISDYYTYNDRSTTALDNGRQPGIHWVGDLAMECELKVNGAEGQVSFDLVEGGIHFRCTIDAATGQAVLSNTGDVRFTGDADHPAATTRTGSTAIRGSGRHQVQFSNIDDELRLLVDGSLVTFDGPTTYLPPARVEPRWSTTDPGDLAPAAIGVQGTTVNVDWIRLKRDVYYLAIVSSGMSDYLNSFSDAVIQDILHSPESWDTTILFPNRRTVEFVIPNDRYFPLGDNSPQSMDGRLWGSETYFEKDMLIGKAMMVYWPHAWRRPIPFLPNFSRMGLIR